MSDESPSKRCPLIPPGDLKCVWMEAGVLAYQLCERQYECESCPLDAALRAHFNRGVPAEKAAEHPAQERAALAEDRRYSRGHCWVRRVESTGADETPRWRVGLEPGLAAALLRTRSVVLPAVGESLRRGQMHLWVVVDGGTFGVVAPLDGTVRASNVRLAERPSLVGSAPMDDGWLYEVEVPRSEPQWAGLMEASTAERGYSSKASRFQAELSKALNARHHAVGETLADGGAPLGDVSQMLGPARYFELLSKIYR